MITPNSNNKANNKADKGGRGVNPVSHNKIIDNTGLRFAVDLYLVSNPIIYKYIKPRIGIRSRSCYQLLLITLVNPYKPVTYFVNRLNSSQNAIEKNLVYLVELGYLRTELQSRTIIPFKRQTKDTVYVITTLGMTVINKIIGTL